jgi:hypothetical protein
MMKNLCFTFLLFVIFSASITWSSDGYFGSPIKYVVGYEVDMNLDKYDDLVFLIETGEGYKLITLIKLKSGYKTYTLLNTKEKVIITCKFCKEIISTEAGKGKNNTHVLKIPGPFIEVSQPEGASSVFYWSKGKFIRVWVSD